MEVLYIPQLDEIGTGGEGEGGGGGGGTAARYRILRRVPEDGTVVLTDRAVTRINIASDGGSLRLVVPPEAKGTARDFFVRLVITADEIPEVTFAAPSGEVEFDPCGGTLDEMKHTFKLGAQYSTMPTPAMSGHTFLGWFTSAEDGIKVEATDRCKTGVTNLYAHWEVYVDPFVDAICEARNLTFFSEGESPWAVDGDGAARSGAIGDNGSTSLTTTVQGAGTLAFRWRTSSESGYDCLRVRLDGTEAASISGESGWLDFSLPVDGAGSHTVEWRYDKDGSVSNGEDCGWINDVVWTPTGG